MKISKLKTGKWRGIIKNKERTIIVEATSESNVKRFLEVWLNQEKKIASIGSFLKNCDNKENKTIKRKKQHDT